MSTLPQVILSAMPGSMADVALRIGVGGPLLWSTAAAMRAAGFLKREGKDAAGKLVYHATGQALPAGWEPGLPEAKPAVDAASAPQSDEEKKKNRKWPVVTFHIPGWPQQEPNRQLVWRIYFDKSRKFASADANHLNRELGHEAVFAMTPMTKNEVYRMKTRGFSIKDQQERVARLRAEADAAVKKRATKRKAKAQPPAS